VATLFDPRAEFATDWPQEGQVQCDLRNLCKLRVSNRIIVQ